MIQCWGHDFGCFLSDMSVGRRLAGFLALCYRSDTYRIT
ncbi:hypothetical protein EMIT043CA1_150132 [Pseudomonas brassicacearum]